MDVRVRGCLTVIFLVLFPLLLSASGSQIRSLAALPPSGVPDQALVVVTGVSPGTSF